MRSRYNLRSRFLTHMIKPLDARVGLVLVLPESPKETPCKVKALISYVMFHEERLRKVDVIHLGAPYFGALNQIGRGS